MQFNDYQANQLHGLWNPEVQCCIHKVSPIILSRINPIPHIDTYFFKVHSQITNRVPRPCVIFLNKNGFYSVRLLASFQSPKLEDHSWLDVHNCLFNIITANFHIFIMQGIKIKKHFMIFTQWTFYSEFYLTLDKFLLLQY